MNDQPFAGSFVTNLAFLLRRLEEDGVFYRVRQTGEGEAKV